VDAAALLRDEPSIRFVFQGDGVKKPDLERRVAALGLSNVLFLPYAAKEALGESFAAADVMVVSLQRGLAGYIVPSKLYGILAAGRPYIAAVEETCEVAALTRANDCGLVVEPGNAEDLAASIRRLRNDRSLAARLGDQARVTALTFDRAGQVRRYAGLLESVAQRRTSAAPEAAPERA
jgi:glycosyltransferase involved in cell wall biosynthesis